MLQMCDQTLLFSVWSDGVPASGGAKEKKAGSTGLWLRPVSWDRTRLVVFPGVLDLSVIDRTLDGSVRSIGNMRFLDSFLRFLFYHGWTTM